MKIILFALLIVLAAIGACNPPQKTTETPADSTAVNNNARDTTMSRDTTMPTPKDTMQRDTSMHR